MKATLTNYHQSPQKVRLVANLIRGKSVPAARAALAYLPKKSSPAILKLLNSAASNAREQGASEDALFVKMIAVNKGGVMRRFMPKARGRAARYAKTMSIVTLELAAGSGKKSNREKRSEKMKTQPVQSTQPVEAPKTAKKTAKKAAKKAAK